MCSPEQPEGTLAYQGEVGCSEEMGEAACFTMADVKHGEVGREWSNEKWVIST